LPPISTFKPQETKNKNESFQVSQTERKPSKQNFFELYAALNNEEYAKMTTCSFCKRKFRFTSVLLDHLQTHTVNVDNIVEMKLKIWVNGRKLKCSETGCKKKYAYTLEYTKHRDSHHYEGLSCGVCGCKQLGPADYASHIKKEHPEHLTPTETQAEDLPPPPSEAKEDQQQQVSIPSPTVSEAQSPMINQPMQALVRRGFRDISGLDFCRAMLDIAEKKGVYKHLVETSFGSEIPCVLAEKQYDCVVMKGGFAAGHLPLASLATMARLCKPGGLVINSMTLEYTQIVPEYQGLEEYVTKMQEDKVWKMMKRKVIADYINGKDGLLHVFQME